MTKHDDGIEATITFPDGTEVPWPDDGWFLVLPGDNTIIPIDSDGEPISGNLNVRWVDGVMVIDIPEGESDDG